MPSRSTTPGGKTGSIAALRATFATEVMFKRGLNSAPTSGNLRRGFACRRICKHVNIITQAYFIALDAYAK